MKKLLVVSIIGVTILLSAGLLIAANTTSSWTGSAQGLGTLKFSNGLQVDDCRTSGVSVTNASGALWSVSTAGAMSQSTAQSFTGTGVVLRTSGTLQGGTVAGMKWNITAAGVAYVQNLFAAGASFFEGALTVDGAINTTASATIGTYVKAPDGYITDDLLVTDDINTSGDLQVKGNTQLEGVLIVDGAMSTTASATIGTYVTAPDGYITDDLLVTDDINTSGDLQVKGNTQLEGVLIVDGAMSTTSTLTAGGLVTASAGTRVGGATIPAIAAFEATSTTLVGADNTTANLTLRQYVASKTIITLSLETPINDGVPGGIGTVDNWHIEADGTVDAQVAMTSATAGTVRIHCIAATLK